MQADEQPTTPTEVTVESLSGFEEGTVLPDGTTVRGSYDESGNLVGWHKEPPADEAPAEDAAPVDGGAE